MKWFAFLSVFVIEIIYDANTISYAFDNVILHPIINSAAAHQSSLDNYLKNIIGFSEGLTTGFPNQNALFFLADGGTTEDRFTRPFKHFHDPLEPWEKAGLSWAPGLHSTSCLIWAQNYSPLDNDTNQEEWFQARSSYYEALSTRSTESFAATFKTLGQLMHLVSDMAVPAHVRDDAHLEVMLPEKLHITHFEKYTLNLSNHLDYNGLPFKPNMQIYSRFIPHEQASVPISSLWDIDKYQGNNQETTLEPFIGLAEYTNANFFSEGTIFDEYPSPGNTTTNYMNIDWAHPEIIVAEDGQPDNRIYIKKLIDGQTIQFPRLVAMGYFSRDWISEDCSGFYTLVLDDAVYHDYASVLIPRAIGYSASLLDYFFRGSLSVRNAMPQPGIPTVQGDGVLQWMTPIWDIGAEVQNISTLGTDDDGNPVPEPLGIGSLIGVARFKSGATERYAFSEAISVDVALADALNSGEPQSFLFHFPTGIWVGATDLTLQVIFQGTLGSEQEIAVAVGRCAVPAGTLAITFPDEFVYAIIDGSVSPNQFTQIKAKIRNTTTMIDENGQTVPVEVAEGSVHAVAVYKVIPGLLEDLSNYPQDNATMASLMAGEPFTSSISAPIPIDSLSSQQAGTYIFDFTADPIPTGVTDLYLAVYYEGTAQTDQSNITCLGGKDMNEPQYISYWNDTDYFLLYGEAVKADDIRDDSDVELYGYIEPHRISEFLGFSAAYPFVNPPLVASAQLIDAARYSKLIILTENVDHFYVTDRVLCHFQDGAIWFDGTFKYTLPGFINQMQLGYVWEWTPVYTIRGIIQHQSAYFMNSYPYFLYINTLPAPPENALGPFPVTINFP